MGYWKSKVLPKIKKVFEKNGKKTAAAEACKSFDGSKVSFWVQEVQYSRFSCFFHDP